MPDERAEQAEQPTVAEVEATIRTRGRWLLIAGSVLYAVVVVVAVAEPQWPVGIWFAAFTAPTAALIVGALEAIHRPTRRSVRTIIANQAAIIEMGAGLTSRMAKLEAVVQQMPGYGEGLLEGAQIMRRVTSTDQT